MVWHLPPASLTLLLIHFPSVAAHAIRTATRPTLVALVAEPTALAPVATRQDGPIRATRAVSDLLAFSVNAPLPGWAKVALVRRAVAVVVQPVAALLLHGLIAFDLLVVGGPPLAGLGVADLHSPGADSVLLPRVRSLTFTDAHTFALAFALTFALAFAFAFTFAFTFALTLALALALALTFAFAPVAGVAAADS